MRFTCSLASIGGEGSLPDMNRDRRINIISMDIISHPDERQYIVRSNVWAKYSYSHGSMEDSSVYTENLPSGITKDEVTMSGIFDDRNNTKDNLDTIMLSVNIPQATCAHFTGVACVFGYRDLNGTYRAVIVKDFPTACTDSSQTRPTVQSPVYIHHPGINIVTPKPLILGQQMNVTCSLETIGGVSNLPGINNNHIGLYAYIRKYRHVQAAEDHLPDVEINNWIAGYDYGSDYLFVFPGNGLGLTKHNFTVHVEPPREEVGADGEVGGYGGDLSALYNLTNNIDRITLTMTLDSATEETATGYSCSYDWRHAYDVHILDYSPLKDSTQTRPTV